MKTATQIVQSILAISAATACAFLLLTACASKPVTLEDQIKERIEEQRRKAREAFEVLERLEEITGAGHDQDER